MANLPSVRYITADRGCRWCLLSRRMMGDRGTKQYCPSQPSGGSQAWCFPSKFEARQGDESARINPDKTHEIETRLGNRRIFHYYISYLLKLASLIAVTEYNSLYLSTLRPSALLSPQPPPSPPCPIPQSVAELLLLFLLALLTNVLHATSLLVY